MEMVRQGAEAKLFKTVFGGKPALLKARIPKEYRCRQLDDLLRATRTSREASLLRKARGLGVRTPAVYSVDRGKKEILMEFVEGPRLKDVLSKKNLGLCRPVGEAIAAMHASNLIHGDLTTSNILVKGKELYFIDFGLGYGSARLEDKAVDLLVFQKTFEATHVELMPKGWNLVLEGYLEKGGSKTVVRHMEKVRERARYH